MRYERKYRVTGLSPSFILHELMNNPSVFKTSYDDRIINSIYYDNATLKAYYENQQGISYREKYRLRWYGESLKFIQKPVIEKKVKINMLGFKEYMSIDDFNLETNLVNVDEEKPIRELGLYPVALVRYRRSYFESFDHNIRATIDQDLQYYIIQGHQLLKHAVNDRAIIVEIKYEEACHELADACLQAIPFRLTKNSKYVSAVSSLMC